MEVYANAFWELVKKRFKCVGRNLTYPADFAKEGMKSVPFTTSDGKMVKGKTPQGSLKTNLRRVVKNAASPASRQAERKPATDKSIANPNVIVDLVRNFDED